MRICWSRVGFMPSFTMEFFFSSLVEALCPSSFPFPEEHPATARARAAKPKIANLGNRLFFIFIGTLKFNQRFVFCRILAPQCEHAFRRRMHGQRWVKFEG